MEQGQCWMWTKRKYSMSSYLTSSTNASYDDSWEEQAFAEDAAGSLGGCIWPPRSYTCSFCRREFRSAQALGGHMNVHRRDRARLKQTSSPQNEVQNPFTSLGFLYPSSPVCGLAYNTNPNSDPSVLASPSSRSPSKALLAPSSIIENCREEILIPTHNSSESWSKLAEERLYSQKFNPEADDAEKISKILGCGCLNKGGNYVQFETKEEAAISCKKRRTDIASSIQFFPKSNSFDRHHRGKVFEFSSSSIEELDLELRLGQRPEGSFSSSLIGPPEGLRYLQGEII